MAGPTDSGRPSPAVGSARARLGALVVGFGGFGLMFGVWQVALPDLTLALRLDEAALGLALSVGFVGSFPAMWLAGRGVDRVGPLPVVAVAAAVMSSAFLVLALVPPYVVLVATLLAFFGASGAFDVGLNSAAVGLERDTGRHVLTPLHAAFSGGALLGAVAGGALVPLGVPFQVGYLAVPLVLGGATLALARARLPRPDRAGVVAGADADAGGGAPRVRAFAPALVALGAIAMVATLSEGALESWSAIYLRLTLGMPAELGAAGVAVFHAAMVLGRLGGGPVVARLGRTATLTLAGGVTALAMPLALATTAPLLVLGGFFVVALGLSVLFPIAVSLAGDVPGATQGRAASSVITIGYAGFVAGPAVIGAVASLVSLRVALLVVALGGLVTIGLARGPLRARPPAVR